MNIGEKIKKVRTKKGLRQMQICKETGLSQGYLSDLENGRVTNPTLAILNKITEALGVTTDGLLGDNNLNYDSEVNGMDIKTLCKEAHENAEKHGFWEDITNSEPLICLEKSLKNGDKLLPDENNAIGNRLMLIVSELGEAQEGLRHGDMDNFKEELADVAIRLGDLCGGLNIDLEAEITKKMEKNKNRPYKHNKAF